MTLKRKPQHTYFFDDVRIYFTFVFFVKENTIWVGEILGWNSWITPSFPNQHVFFVSIFSNLAIIVGKELEKMGKIQKKIVKRKKLPKNREKNLNIFSLNE